MCPDGLAICVFETGMALLGVVVISIFVLAGLGVFDNDNDK